MSKNIHTSKIGIRNQFETCNQPRISKKHSHIKNWNQEPRSGRCAPLSINQSPDGFIYIYIIYIYTEGLSLRLLRARKRSKSPVNMLEHRDTYGQAQVCSKGHQRSMRVARGGFRDRTPPLDVRLTVHVSRLFV